MKKLLFFIAFLLALFIFPKSSFAATIAVNTTSDELLINGNCSLREAIQSANTNIAFDNCISGNAFPTIDVISIPVGTYTISPLLIGASDDNSSGDFDIFDSVSISGVDALSTVINGNDIDRVFDVHIPDYDGGVVSFSKIAVTNGKSLAYNPNTFVGTVVNLVEDGGGGIRCGRGATHYTYTPNLVHDIDLVCNFSDMEIADNETDGLGAGVLCGGRNDQGAFNLNGHTGGVSCSFDKVTIVGNIHSPSATAANKVGGGGVACVNDTTFHTDSTCEFTNTTISGNGNTTTPVGGGILCINSTIDIAYSSIYSNTASEAGGIGVQKQYSSFANDYINCPISVIGSLIENNATTFPNCQAGINTTSGGYNIESNSNCNLLSATDLSNTPVQLDTLDYHSPAKIRTHIPSPSSPAIDGGPLAICTKMDGSTISIDTRGISRPLDSDGDSQIRCDVGAFEIENVDLALSGTDDPDPVTLGNSLNYNLTISNPTNLVAYDVVFSHDLVISHLASPPVIVPSSGYCNYNAPSISCYFTSIPAGGNITIAITSTTIQSGLINASFFVDSTTSDDANTTNNTLNLTSSIQIGSSGSPVNCPSGTSPLFPTSTPALTPGQNLAFGGNISNINWSGSWRTSLIDGIPMTENGNHIEITFPTPGVYIHSVLIYDNDPKSGESPWSINGINLPTTPNNSWGAMFPVNLTTSHVIFDNGGNSPHFNLCISNTGVSPTKTPTPTIPPGTIVPTDSPTPSSATQIPTPSMGVLSSDWWIAKNTSLHLINNTNVGIPSPLGNCDTGTQTCLIEGNAGLFSVNSGLVLPPFVTPSQNQWVKYNHDPSSLFKSSDAFFSYLENRPNVITFSNISDFSNPSNSLSSDKIYIIESGGEWSSDINFPASGNLTVVVKGDLLISRSVADDKFITFISSGKISFASDLKSARGIFIAKQISFSDGVSSQAENHLEIYGNVYSFDKADGYANRNSSLPTPPVKIEYDINQVMKFINVLSIKKTTKQ